MKESKKQYNFRMRPSMVDRLRVEAEKDGRSVSNMLEQLIEAYLKEASGK